MASLIQRKAAIRGVLSSPPPSSSSPPSATCRGQNLFQSFVFLLSAPPPSLPFLKVRDHSIDPFPLPPPLPIQYRTNVYPLSVERRLRRTATDSAFFSPRSTRSHPPPLPHTHAPPSHPLSLVTSLSACLFSQGHRLCAEGVLFCHNEVRPNEEEEEEEGKLVLRTKQNEGEAHPRPTPQERLRCGRSPLRG